MKKMKKSSVCGCSDCSEPAITTFCCGIVPIKKGSKFLASKRRYIDSPKTLFKVEMKGDCSFPVCRAHKKVLDLYFNGLTGIK